MGARRLGLFGGTFDPPHRAHVAALVAAWASGDYDRIMVVVAGEPYQKSPARSLSSAQRRLAMAHAAFDGLEGVVVSDREVRRGGPSYTIDTVLELEDEGWLVELIVGADVAARLDGWFRAEELCRHVTVAVLPRPGGAERPSASWRIHDVDMVPIDLSSTEVRSLEPADARVAELLPDAVVPLWRAGRG